MAPGASRDHAGRGRRGRCGRRGQWDLGLGSLVERDLDEHEAKVACGAAPRRHAARTRRARGRHTGRGDLSRASW